MRLRCWFRSPHVQCFSVIPVPVNVPGGLAATPLATLAPGKENHRCAVPSAYSFRLSGRARSYIHVGRALSAHPCASPRPAGNASAIFSRTAVWLEDPLFQKQRYRCYLDLTATHISGYKTPSPSASAPYTPQESPPAMGNSSAATPAAANSPPAARTAAQCPTPSPPASS